MADVEADELKRMAALIDPATGSSLNYGQVRSDYEESMRLGNNSIWLSRGMLIAGGATLIPSVALFAAHAHKSKKQRVLSRAFALELKF